MATIEIVAWKEHFVGGTGWDAHAKAEFRKRLRRGIKASQSEIRRLIGRVDAREIVCLSDVHDEAVYELTQMLRAIGADIRVSLADANSERLSDGFRAGEIMRNELNVHSCNEPTQKHLPSAPHLA